MGLELLLKAAKHIDEAATTGADNRQIEIDPFQQPLTGYNFARNYIEHTYAAEAKLLMPTEIRNSSAFANPYPPRIRSTSEMRLQSLQHEHGTSTNSGADFRNASHQWPYSFKVLGASDEITWRLDSSASNTNFYKYSHNLLGTGRPKNVDENERRKDTERSRRANEVKLLERLRLLLPEMCTLGRQPSKREILETSARRIKILKLRNEELDQEMMQLFGKRNYLQEYLSNLQQGISDEDTGVTLAAGVVASKIVDMNGNDISFQDSEAAAAGTHVLFEVNFAQHPTFNHK